LPTLRRNAHNTIRWDSSPPRTRGT
jgi:hypothetical protein